MASDINLVTLAGIEMTPQEFKGVVTRKQYPELWRLAAKWKRKEMPSYKRAELKKTGQKLKVSTRDFARAYACGAYDFDAQPLEKNGFGWMAFLRRDYHRLGLMGGVLEFLIGKCYVDNECSMGIGDGTSGAYLEIPELKQLITDISEVKYRLEEMGIKGPDVRVYSVAYKR